MTRLGFAGLGRMGMPMARNLARAGFDMSLWNRSSEKAVDLAGSTDCRIADSPAELAENSDVVITMLGDDSASASVHFGPDGLFAAAASGTRIFIEMGTMSPAHIAALADSAPEGCRVVDAPVSGATQAAENAQLLIMAGCREEDASGLQPILAAMGRRTIFLGSTGAGSVMKLAVNTLIHGINQNFSEAMLLAEAAGIESETAFDVIEDSAAAAPMLKYRRPLYLDEENHDVTFTVALARKDMAIATDLARRLGVDMPQNKVTFDMLQEATACGYAERDMASVLSYMRERNA